MGHAVQEGGQGQVAAFELLVGLGQGAVGVQGVSDALPGGADCGTSACLARSVSRVTAGGCWSWGRWRVACSMARSWS